MTNYLGELTYSVCSSQDRLNSTLVKEAQIDEDTIPVVFLFFKKYKCYPLTLASKEDSVFCLPCSKALSMLSEELQHDPKNDIIYYYWSIKHNVSYADLHLADLGDGLMLELSGGYMSEHLNFVPHFYAYKIYYLPGKEEAVERLVQMMIGSAGKQVAKASLQMICKYSCGFYLADIEIKKPTIGDLKLHYGDEFERVHNTIMNALTTDEAHGLILLHGLPGSGKTHYIRYLIHEITDKRLVYIPPDMTPSITTPEFLPFMLQNKNSILIIEDAENIIKSRDSEEATKNQSVANLLNLSDGLLGDSLHQPIIATFNCELNTIDPALLRKGRLIAEYEFGKLAPQSAQKLSNKLGFNTKITESMTLADIYGQPRKEENA